MHRASESPFQNRPVQFAQLLLGFLLLDADHDAVRMKEILHRCAFAQEFRIGSHAKLRSGIRRIHREGALELLSRLRRHRTLLDHQLGRARFLGDHARHIVDRREVRFPCFRRGRTHANKNNVRLAHRFTGVRREAQSPLANHALQHFVQMRLVNRNFPGLQRGNSRAIVVGGNHFVPRLGQTTSRHKPYVPAANHR